MEKEHFKHGTLDDNHLLSIKVTKVCLMLLIVLYHSFLFLNGKWFATINIEYHPIPAHICEWINSFSIYAFTFLSGYIYISSRRMSLSLTHRLRFFFLRKQKDYWYHLSLYLRFG